MRYFNNLNPLPSAPPKIHFLLHRMLLRRVPVLQVLRIHNPYLEHSLRSPGWPSIMPAWWIGDSWFHTGHLLRSRCDRPCRWRFESDHLVERLYRNLVLYRNHEQSRIVVRKKNSMGTCDCFPVTLFVMTVVVFRGFVIYVIAKTVRHCWVLCVRRATVRKW